MGGFDDIKVSLRMREIIASIAKTVVNELRPEVKVGKVFSYDGSKRTAQILMPNETIENMITAHVADNMIPTFQMATTFNTAGYAAQGNIVRVSGKPGSYYISDYVLGRPDLFLGRDVGFIHIWPGATVPSAEYLFCRGQSFSALDYPALAAVVGDTYGAHSGNTYYVPNFKARSPIGVGGVADSGSGGNAYSVGQKFGDERLHQHNHGVSDPGHVHGDPWRSSGYEAGGFALTTGGNGFFDRVAVSGGGQFNTGGNYTGISIQNAGSGAAQNVHPVIGMNFIIKGK